MVKVKQVTEREVEATDNGDGTFSLAVPPDARGELSVVANVNGEDLPAGSLSIAAEEAPVDDETAALVQSKMPGSSKAFLRALSMLSPSERAELVGELQSGLKDDGELEAVRAQEAEARAAREAELEVKFSAEF